MHRITLQGHKVNLKILNNKVSAKQNPVIEEDWKITYQIIPLDIQQRNAAECDIHTFKEHFLTILEGIDDAFPK